MPGTTILSANGSTFSSTNCVVDDKRDLYVNNVYYKSLNGVTGPTNYGYAAGGNGPTSVSLNSVNTIERYPYSLSITNTTNVGTLTIPMSWSTAASSDSYGYKFGGQTNSPAPNVTNVISRFPFSLAITNATGAGTLDERAYQFSHTHSTTYAYRFGGQTTAPATSYTIRRFPFALAITSEASVGSMTEAMFIGSSQYSSTYGYVSGGYNTAVSNKMWSLPFALSITNVTNIGTLTVARQAVAGHSSSSYGYASGGTTDPAQVTNAVSTIDRFPFSLAITNATNVGTLISARSFLAGTSSMSYGYSQGGRLSPPNVFQSTIDRFPFSLSITNAASVGSLSSIRQLVSQGIQY